MERNMRIEYVLIEKQDDKQQKPSKSRITAFLRNQFPDISTNTIYIQGKRKNLKLNIILHVVRQLMTEAQITFII